MPVPASTEKIADEAQAFRYVVALETSEYESPLIVVAGNKVDGVHTISGWDIEMVNKLSDITMGLYFDEQVNRQGSVGDLNALPLPVDLYASYDYLGVRLRVETALWLAQGQSDWQSAVLEGLSVCERAAFCSAGLSHDDAADKQVRAITTELSNGSTAIIPDIWINPAGVDIGPDGMEIESGDLEEEGQLHLYQHNFDGYLNVLTGLGGLANLNTRLLCGE